MDPVKELTTNDFANTVAGSGVAVVYFWGTYCGPCRAMAPELERAAALAPWYRFLKQNINDHRGPSFELGIHTIPAVAVFQSGRLLGTRGGVLSAEELIGVCDDLVAAAPSSLAA